MGETLAFINLCVAGVGIIFTIMSIIAKKQYDKQFTESYRCAIGTLIDTKRCLERMPGHVNVMGETRAAVYEYYVDGIRYTYIDDMIKLPKERWVIGSKKKLYYNPTAPEKVITTDYRFVQKICFGVGIGLLVITAVMTYINKRLFF